MYERLEPLTLAGINVIILKIFSPKIFAKNFGKNIGVFCSNYCYFCKNIIIILAFEKNANFFAENWQKSQKIVIITSTPGLEPMIF
jgi:hypothetical protein